MFVRSLVLLGVLAVTATTYAADSVSVPWKEGTQYFAIDPPVATDFPGKIEVTEVFSYGCPACNFAYPIMDKLRKSLPPNAVMNYVPASFNANEDWPMFQRAYYTAQALGVAEKSHDAMFDAVWKNRTLATVNEDGRTLKRPQPSIEDAANKFYAQYGVKPGDFIATANSFAVNTNMRRADAYLKATGTDSTPTIVVAGKYRLTLTSAGGEDKLIPLVQYLIQRESAGK